MAQKRQVIDVLTRYRKALNQVENRRRARWRQTLIALPRYRKTLNKALSEIAETGDAAAILEVRGVCEVIHVQLARLSGIEAEKQACARLGGIEVEKVAHKPKREKPINRQKSTEFTKRELVSVFPRYQQALNSALALLAADKPDSISAARGACQQILEVAKRLVRLGEIEPRQLPSTQVVEKPRKKVYIESRRGTKIAGSAKCEECERTNVTVWEYADSNFGRVRLCAFCKADAFNRSFGNIDALDMTEDARSRRQYE
jgi:hypothetical protein